MAHPRLILSSLSLLSLHLEDKSLHLRLNLVQQRYITFLTYYGTVVRYLSRVKTERKCFRVEKYLFHIHPKKRHSAKYMSMGFF